MKLRASLVLILLTQAVTAACAGEARPLEPLDLWKVKRIGPPSVAPDGKWCVVEVTTWDLDSDESSSNLWLLSTDGAALNEHEAAVGGFPRQIHFRSGGVFLCFRLPNQSVLQPDFRIDIR